MLSRTSKTGGYLCVWITATVLGFVQHGCFPGCNDIACIGGFYLDITMDDDSNLPQGEYEIFMEVDEYSLYSKCIVAETQAATSCGDKSKESWRLSEGLGVDWPSSFYFYAVFMEEDSISGSMRGPEHISIRIELDGEVVGEEEFFPIYERDHNYFGDEECGYCDLEVQDQMTLALPE